MATKVVTDGFVSLAGTDISAWVRSIEFTVENDVLEDTTMGVTAKSRVAGLEDTSTRIDCRQEYGAAGLEKLLWDNKGTSVTVIVRPESGAASATNPQYTGTALIMEMHPISAGVGEMATESFELPGTGAFARAVA